MAESIAKTFFPTLYGKIEKRKQAALNVPLSQNDINTLLGMHFNNRPVYPSIDLFFSEEYKAALANGVSGEELDRIPRFRTPTPAEVNQLLCDLHIREDKIPYSQSNSGDS